MTPMKSTETERMAKFRYFSKKGNVFPSRMLSRKKKWNSPKALKAGDRIRICPL